ncbi:sensor histidine kinase [Dechloromonas sp. XY25]|uniref:Oxygen sensor histidine kinase NreB n=1 Tax=Dechloromonas hankyongensis TaxID=2908002 RepID=A0ABS9JZ85_9RHOO|nr:sensor histidine kinase [Dechloromonas hankyongensis]MCG2576229.1 sensor histidine kinase [Dechloromonas hankyongensis]
MASSKFRFLINPAIATAMAAIFVIDLHTPLGLAVPFLYLLLALLAIGVGAQTRVLVIIAVVGPILAGIKLQIHPSDGVVWVGQTNRLIFSMLIWIAVGLECVRRRLEAGRRENSRLLEKQVAERTEALRTANQKLEVEIAERKEAEATIGRYASRLEALSNQLVTVQDSERKALATELHDRIGQNLSALNMSLNLNLALLSGPLSPAALSAAQVRIRDALTLVEQTTEKVRSVMEELHPALLEQYGLTTALRWHGEEFAGRTGIAFRYSAGENLPRWPGKVETTLFRIAQEALVNVAKHAEATAVTVALTQGAEGIALTISDNGVGLAPEPQRPPAAGSGWGLAIMAERARAVGGALQIGPGHGQGTAVVVTIPNRHLETA